MDQWRCTPNCIDFDAEYSKAGYKTLIIRNQMGIFFWKRVNEEQFFTYIQNLQDQIVAGLEAVDGQAKFKEIYRNAKAAADTRVIENGKVLKKAV
jgi:histidinol phosphatase-like enzyme